MSASTALVLVLATLEAAGAAPASARAEAKEWLVEASPRAAGGASAAELRLASRAGYHVNLDYPMAFVPSPEATVRFQGTRVPLRPETTRPCPGDAKQVCSASLVLPYTPPAGGSARVAGVFAFSVCSSERCLIQKVPLSIDVPAPARG